ncbi:MAG: hypothetical protein IJ692_03785 [Alloprevotella sp.]|nr:hypothetical protein [Alloprevotella sp.]
MKLRPFIFCLLTLAVFPAPSLLAQTAFSAETQALLDSLETAVENKAQYAARREHDAERLKQDARQADGALRIAYLKRLYENYLHVQADSAMNYVEAIASMPEVATDEDLQNYVCISRAYIWALRGQYREAMGGLADVNRQAFTDDMRLYYFRTMRTAYGWMANYAEGTPSAQALLEKTQLYRDSILQMPQSENSRLIVMADQAIWQTNPREALRLSGLSLRSSDETRVYSYSIMADAYRMLGDTEQEVYYLAKTALHDIRSGVTEYQALPRLAQRLYEAGHVRTAYSFLLCAIEDATLCKAPLRSFEASNLLTIVDKTYKSQERRQKRLSYLFISGLTSFTLLLVFMVVWLRRQMRKLTQARRELAEANARLQTVNDELLEANESLRRVHSDLLLTDKMKEEYIARYLDRCRDYLDEIDHYRRSLLRLSKAGKSDALHKQLTSEAWVMAERKRFYADFDHAFLSLFPHFVEKFNALLQPEARVELRPVTNDPKRRSGERELLTQELRLFALIRLGVSESNRIAHFLGLSLTTVYNYRSRFRGKALCSKDDFEARVMEI